MSNPPVYDEGLNGGAGRMVGAIPAPPPSGPKADVVIPVGRQGRRLCLYPGQLGYDLQDELDYLSNRAMEPNAFFSGRFLAPAIPRLDERKVRIALMRDENQNKMRSRLLIPYSVEKPGFSIGPTIMRVWANPFAPLGTPLLDGEEAAETIDNLLEALTSPSARLPDILVLPDLRLNGRFSQLLRAVAISRDLSVTVANPQSRPFLESYEDGDAYLKKAISKEHLREARRQFRKLAGTGNLVHSVARQPADIRYRLEEFLALEASGWKGRKRSAMVMDRFHAAFVREAVTNLAEADAVRIHTLDFNGRAIASLIVFVMGGEAYTWKTAFDETFARFSPGKLLMIEVTEWNLDDANIARTDSCAAPDHPIMSRLWTEREEMGTLVIGLRRNSDREVRQVATQLHLYRNTRNVARILRDKILARRVGND